MRISWRLLPLLSLLLPACATPAQSTPAATAAMHEAEEFSDGGMLTSAMDSYRKALKLSNGDCADCLRAIYGLALQADQPKAALAAAQQLERSAHTPAERSAATVLYGQAMLPQDLQATPTAKQMAEAEAQFARAVTLDPENGNALLLDGHMLALMHRDAEAVARFRTAALLSGNSTAATARAQHLAEHVELARRTPAPVFTFETRDGKQMSLDDFRGKVVLIDFWATWCGPCRREISYIRSIARDRTLNDRLVLLSVSWDRNSDAWNKAIDEEGMKWLHTRDTRHTMSDLFRVTAIPTYVIIDADGLVRHREVGGGTDLRTQLRTLVHEMDGDTVQAKSGTP